MKEKTGEVFSIGKDNPPISGCTTSKEIYGGINNITYFSMAKNTDISAEIYPYHKMILMADGSIDVYGTDGFQRRLGVSDVILTPTEIPIGVRTSKSAVYTEIFIRREDIMNEVMKAGEVFRLAELVPYQEGKIVNMDIVHNEKMKFVVMAFDEETGLSEHAAPGDALIFALEGCGIIGYDGEEHRIKVGENFKFAAGGKHWVRADGKFKMALLLILD